MRVLLLMLLLLPAACQSGTRGRVGEGPSSGDAMASDSLIPLGRFVGTWEGSVESVTGNYRLARRVQWLVKDSWLMEQNVVYDTTAARELERHTTLYAYDQESGRLVASLLLPGGRRLRSYVSLREDGFTREHQPLGEGGTATLTQTALFNGTEWQGRNFIMAGDGNWHEADRFSLQKRP